MQKSAKKKKTRNSFSWLVPAQLHSTNCKERIGTKKPQKTQFPHTHFCLRSKEMIFD